MFSKRFLQRFIFRPAHPFFSPIQDSCQRGSLANTDIRATSDGIFFIIILLDFTYALTSRVKWVHSCSHEHSYI